MSTIASSRLAWEELADLVIAGESISRENALSVLLSDDAELPSLIAAAWRVRREFWGNTVQL